MRSPVLCMTHSPEGSQHLVVDALKNRLWCIQLDKEHDEDAVVWQLLKLCVTHLMVLQQHSSNNSQHLLQEKPLSLNISSRVQTISNINVLNKQISFTADQINKSSNLNVKFSHKYMFVYS